MDDDIIGEVDPFAMPKLKNKQAQIDKSRNNQVEPISTSKAAKSKEVDWNFAVESGIYDSTQANTKQLIKIQKADQIEEADQGPLTASAIL